MPVTEFSGEENPSALQHYPKFKNNAQAHRGHLGAIVLKLCKICDESLWEFVSIHSPDR